MRYVFSALFVLALLAGPSRAAPVPEPEGKTTEESPPQDDWSVGELIPASINQNPYAH